MVWRTSQSLETISAPQGLNSKDKYTQAHQHTVKGNGASQPIIRAKHTCLIKQIYPALIGEDHYISSQNVHQKVVWKAWFPKW